MIDIKKNLNNKQSIIEDIRHLFVKDAKEYNSMHAKYGEHKRGDCMASQCAETGCCVHIIYEAMLADNKETLERCEECISPCNSMRKALGMIE